MAIPLSLKLVVRSSAAIAAALALLSSPATAQSASCPIALAEPTVDLESSPSPNDLAACGVEIVPGLLLALRHPDWQQRSAAAYLLGQLGSKAELAVPALASTLEDSYPAVRFTATKALGQIGSAEGVTALVKALEDEDESVRANAILALIQLGADARSGLPTLSEVLNERGIFESHYPSMVCSSAEFRDCSSVSFQIGGLAAVLEDGNWFIRHTAVETLAQIGKTQPDTLPLMYFSGNHPSGVVNGLEQTLIRRIGTEPLIGALQSPSENTRRAAAEMLGELRSAAAVPTLLLLLNDADEYTQVVSIEAVGKIGSAVAVAALIEQMQADSSTVRREAAIALGRINDDELNPEVVAALTAALSSDIGDSAAEALGLLGAEAAIPVLVSTMRESNLAVCQSAAVALGRIGSPVAVSALMEVLQQEDWSLRSCALKALGQIPLQESSEALIQARRQAVPLLVEALQQTWLQAPEGIYQDELGSIELRMDAASALALVDTDVVPYLIEALPADEGVPIFVELLLNTTAKGTAQPRLTYRDFQTYIGPADDRLVAIANAYIDVAGPTLAPVVTAALNPDWALDDLGPALLLANYVADEATLAALVNLLDHPDAQVRASAAAALSQWQVDASVPALISLLQDPDRQTAWQAAQTLGKMGSKAALPALMEALNHEDYWVRADAATALGQLGSETALPALVQTLQDEDWEVRRNAVSAVGKIGTDAAVPLLITALEDPNFYVSYAATEALGQVGPQVIEALLRVLDQAPLPPVLQAALQDYEVQRRRAAAFALGRILQGLGPVPSDAAAVDGLRAAATNPQEHPEVRRMAATALAQIGIEVPANSSETIPLTLDCAGVDPHIHRYAGQCVYEDIFQGGDGLYEIYESLRKLLRRR
jgi:HEAT repeat protein